MATPHFRSQPLLSRRGHARSGFTMAEMLIVMGIMTILAASLIVLVPRLRTSAMCKAAAADIQQLSIAITQFRDDKGYYPYKPYAPAPADIDNPKWYDYMDKHLYLALTEPNFDVQNPPASANGPFPQTGKGWGGARDDWEFIRGDSKANKQFRDPWGVPYYYVPSTCYLIGVRIQDPTDDTPLKTTAAPVKALPNCYGTTPTPDDFRVSSPGKPDDHYLPKQTYFGPPPDMSVFYNSTTFQIHSKGPDQKTDYYDAEPGIIDALDRGCDPDDITNFGGSRVSN